MRAVYKKWTITTWAASAIVALNLCTAIAATTAEPAKPMDEKAVVIRPTNQAPAPAVVQVAAPVQQQLEVTIKSSKEIYNVGETVSFQVKGNGPYYLWLFAVNEEAQRARMLVPSFLQKGNKYEGGKTYALPASTKYELFADIAGIEKVVMVASTHWVTNFDEKLFSKKDNYYTTSPANLETYLKGLRLRHNSPQKPDKQVIVRDLSFLVTAPVAAVATPTTPVVAPVAVPVAAPPAAVVASDTVVFVSQNKTSYVLGEKVSVVYGANKPGWVHVYVEYPNGRAESLFVQEVDGKRFYTFEADAVRPAGDQFLMAVFTPEKESSFTVDLMSQFTDYMYRNKGLRLRQEQRPSYDMSRFTIE